MLCGRHVFRKSTKMASIANNQYGITTGDALTMADSEVSQIIYQKIAI